MKKVLVFCGILFFIKPLFAADLMDIYQHALDNDPVFKAAYDTYMINTELVPQARAALLPQLTLNGAVGKNYQNTVAGGLGATGNFQQQSWQLTASQAVFNYQAWKQVSQAKASVKAAQATFNDAAQDLMLRTSKVYFDVLLAKDTLEFAEAKKRANKRQLDQATQRFQVGLDAITSVYEAKAAYDQSIATVIAANNNQVNQIENLRKLTNHYYEIYAPLRDNKIPLTKPEPNNVDQWVDTGLKQNYKLYSSKYALEAAKENLKALSAGAWPVFSIQGNTSQIQNDVEKTSVFIYQQSVQSNVALAVNFPVIQGGLVESKTRQAQHNYRLFSEKFEQTHRDMIVNTRIAFNTIIDGISKVTADKQTVISQKNSLESTEAQFEVGTRTMVDVVNAQQRLFEAQEQLARDQYDLIFALLNLKYLAGTLNANDLELVNSWLATTRVYGLAPSCSTKKAS